MKPANFAPVYVGMYPPLAEIARKHGYALAVHGSMGRDFDLIAIPWVDGAANPQDVVDSITAEFALKEIGTPDIKEHGRIRYTLRVSFGECFVDLSFMPLIGQSTTATKGEEK